MRHADVGHTWLHVRACFGISCIGRMGVHVTSTSVMWLASTEGIEKGAGSPLVVVRAIPKAAVSLRVLLALWGFYRCAKGYSTALHCRVV